jgi:phytanoyl-CoA hydroxylase
MSRPNILQSDGVLNSKSWIDQSDALDMVNFKVQNPEDRALVRSFIQNGYVEFDLNLSDAFLKEAIMQANHLWEMRPHDVLAASMEFNGGRPFPMNQFPKLFQSGPGCRILDSHSHSPILKELAAHPKITRIVQAMMDSRPVATQSLYFPYGSMQPLHRDPWFVVTTPVENLFAVWIALEDIDESCGPLTVVPGSHRLPWKPLNNGDIIFHAPDVTQAARDQHVNAMNYEIDINRLRTKKFTTNKGRALLWHAALVHGGSPVSDPSRTRHSFVVHFDNSLNHPAHSQAVAIEGSSPKIISTTHVTELNGALVFDNPCVGQMDWV